MCGTFLIAFTYTLSGNTTTQTQLNFKHRD